MSPFTPSKTGQPVSFRHRPCNFVVLLGLFGMALAGCSRELDLSDLPTLPAHWRNVTEQGIDTKVGHFASTEKSLVIAYDIGPLAGSYVKPTLYPKYDGARSARFGGSSFYYRLSNDQTLLYVTFPDEGPANYSAKVNGQRDVDYILELLARYRHELLRQSTALTNSAPK
jgi:hypothetical protein